eukprot:4439955-Heterocapsa_arctica.AAC.1
MDDEALFHEVPLFTNKSLYPYTPEGLHRGKVEGDLTMYLRVDKHIFLPGAMNKKQKSSNNYTGDSGTAVVSATPNIYTNTTQR